jgi:hypothetical protein
MYLQQVQFNTVSVQAQAHITCVFTAFSNLTKDQKTTLSNIFVIWGLYGK